MPINKEKIAELQSESLMDLLIAQCSDLEALLVLAKRESAAANADNFGELFAVFGERAAVGNRLESYHRQLSELRALLGPSGPSLVDSAVAKETVRLGMEIQAQDTQTSSLLAMVRARTSDAIFQLDSKRRNSLAYLNGGTATGLNCNRRA